MIQAFWLDRYLGLWPYIHRAILGGDYKAKQNRCWKQGLLPKFQSKNFLKIQEYPRVNDSVGKKRRRVVWTVRFIVEWFKLTVADFLYAQSRVHHYRAKLTRLLCHRFVNSGFPRKTNFAYK